MTAQADADVLDRILFLCEWIREHGDVPLLSDVEHRRAHAAWHWGYACPFERAVAVILDQPDPGEDVAEWRIDIDGALDAKGRIPLSLNDRGMHWAAKATKTARVHAVVRNAVMAASVPHLEHVHVEMHYRPKTNRFRDIDNTVATLKPAIDALHSPDRSPSHPVPYDPIVDGDDPRYVTWSPPVLHPPAKGQPPALWLILRSVG